MQNLLNSAMQNSSLPNINFSFTNQKFKYGTQRGSSKERLKYLLIFCWLVAALLLVCNPATFAQCKTGCTSNDVQIKSAYLMQNKTGTPLQTCASGSPVSAYLYLDLITNTPRYGVSITANILAKNPQTNALTLIQAVGECFSKPLSSGGASVTTVVFDSPINWTCGSQIELKDVLIGWGTGSSNFCVGIAAQCPATSSKCWKQSATTYIPIVTFPCTAPFVNSQPADQNKCLGQNASFTVGFAEGNPAPAVIKWQVSTNGSSWTDLANNSTYSGVYTPTLTVTNVTSTLNGNKYKAVLTNNTSTHNCGTETDGNATLTVNTAPNLTSSPGSVTICAEENATFSVGFSGGSPLPAIKWQVKAPGGIFTDIQNETASTLTLNRVTYGLNGNEYRAVLTSGACTSLTTDAASLTVHAKPTVATVGYNQVLCGTDISGPLGGNSIGIVGAGVWSYKSGPGSVIFSNPNGGNSTAEVSAFGDYIFTWTISNGSCNSSSADISVSYYENPVLAASVLVQPTCAVPTGTIKVAPPISDMSYSINSTTAFTNTTGEFSGLSAGTYIIRGKKNATGCESDPVVLVVNAAAGAPDVPAIEIINYANPAISTGTFKVKNSVTGLDYGAGFEFKNDGFDATGWVTDPVFTYTAGMGYNILVRKNNDNTCIASKSCPAEQNSQRLAAPPSSTQTSSGKVSSVKQDLTAFPVPFSEKVTITFTSEKDENYVVNLYDLQGKLIRELKNGNAKAGEVVSIEVSGAGMRESMYLARKVSKSGISTIRLLKKD